MINKSPNLGNSSSNRSLDFDAKSKKYNENRPLYKKALGIGKITSEKFAEKQGEKISLKSVEDSTSLTPEREEKLYGIQKIILKEKTDFFEKLDKNDFESAQEIIEEYDEEDKVEYKEEGYRKIYKNVANDYMLDKFSSLVQEKDIENISKFINTFENKYRYDGHELYDIFEVLKNIETNHFSEENLEKISEPLSNKVLSKISKTVDSFEYYVGNEFNESLADIMKIIIELKEIDFISDEQFEEIKQKGGEKISNKVLSKISKTVDSFEYYVGNEFNESLADIMKIIIELKEIDFISDEQFEEIKQKGGEKISNQLLSNILETLTSYRDELDSNSLSADLKPIMKNAMKLKNLDFISDKQLKEIKEEGSKLASDLILSDILAILTSHKDDLDSRFIDVRLKPIMENIMDLKDLDLISNEQFKKIKEKINKRDKKLF